jgi:KDO2-lipid IV(A) lauroyltransferase
MVIFSFLLYYLIILPISLLPFKVLYVISDGLYFLLYKCFGYRRKVVQTNLKNSFPTKTKEELKTIERAFYHHLCDVFVETFKSFSISQTEINKRMVITNPEVMDVFFDQGRNVLIAGGHYNNWEWFAVGLDQQIKHQSVALYTPLRNKFFEGKMRTSRGKYGLQMVSIKEVVRFFETKGPKPTATVFAVDQSPRNALKCHWMTFLNQETGVMYGLEKYAREFDAPVVFGTISKIRRGYYETSFRLITAHPNNEPANHIIETATRMLEADILKSPHSWLWTHRRWKRKRPASISDQTSV